MEVGGAPDIHVTSRFRQNIVVGMDTRQWLAATIGVALFPGNFTHQGVRRLKPVVRHLHRQHAV